MADEELIDEGLPVEGADPVETPEPKPVTPEPPVVKDETGLRDQIRNAVRQASEKEAAKQAEKFNATEGTVRDPVTGKFVPKDKQAASEKVEQPKPITEKPQQAAPTGTEGPKKPDAAPGTWKPDARAKWESTDPVVKNEVLRRESELTQAIAKRDQQIQQINQAYGSIEQVVGPRRAALKAAWGDEGQAIKRMFDLSDFASQDPNGFLAYYMSQPDVASRVDLQKVFGQQAPADDVMRHPVVQQLQQTVSGLQNQVSGFFSQQHSQTVKSIEQQIGEYVSAQDQDGALLRPHFEAVREDVFKLVPALKAQFPDLSVSQILDKAYTTAIHTNDTVSAEVSRMNEEQMRQKWEKEERARRAALANKSIHPGITRPDSNGAVGSSDPSDLRAELVKNMRLWNQGQSPRI